jgi:hypothetical protein
MRASGSMADGRGCWTLTPPPLSPETSSLLNGAGPGVEVEGPQGVVVGAVRGGGGGVTTGATTSAASSVVVASSLSMLRLSRVVVIGHWRWWRSTPGRGLTR